MKLIHDLMNGKDNQLIVIDNKDKLATITKLDTRMKLNENLVKILDTSMKLNEILVKQNIEEIRYYYGLLTENLVKI